MIQIKTAFKAPGEIFPLEKEYFYEAVDFQGAVEFIGPVRFCGSFSCVGQSIEVTGEIRAKLRLMCNRCNEPYERALCLPFSETFSHNSEEEELRIQNGSLISLSEPILGYILMNLPMERLCKDSCKGVCPVCGVNRNEIPCSCSQSVQAEASNPFSALQRLMDDEEV